MIVLYHVESDEFDVYSFWLLELLVAMYSASGVALFPMSLKGIREHGFTGG